MDFTRAGGLYAAPFPSNDLRSSDGSVDLSLFPNPKRIELVAKGLALLHGTRGFARSGAVYFSLTGPVDSGGLPSPSATLTQGSPLFLVGIDPGSPDYLVRYPLQVSFVPDGGPFGSPNLLSLLPLQGVPLRAGETYAAVVSRELRDRGGASLLAPTALRLLVHGMRPSGMPPAAFQDYRRGLAALEAGGVDPEALAGLAVFTTGDPEADLFRFTQDALSRPLPALTSPFTPQEVFDDYCVFASTLSMPDYQSGLPPFLEGGGTWKKAPDGTPELQRTEPANLYVTVPRRPMPPRGFPVVLFIRTGGGGDRPLVDRGPQGFTGGPALAAGTGPALHFARAGFAGASVDGPLGGLRNTTHGDEQFLIFNVNNPGALRDNVRESALELVVAAHVLEGLSFDASSCPGSTGPEGGTVRFDPDHFVLMGHSMGASIAPLVLAAEPRFEAVLLSGSGGSWIENVMYKEHPLEVRPLAEALIGYASEHRSLTENDPVLTLVQWAAEASDSQLYGDAGLGPPALRPLHVLMMQGIVDHYILPRIANVSSLSLGLDLGGDPLDASNPELRSKGETPVLDVLPLRERGERPLPLAGNRLDRSGAPLTRVVVQNPGDGIEDGHEVVFQTDPPKHQYRCFLEGLLGGMPSVPPGGPADAPCP